MDNTLVWVLWAREHDGSGYDLLRVYEDESEAKDVADLIERAGRTREVRVDAVVFVNQRMGRDKDVSA